MVRIVLTCLALLVACTGEARGELTYAPFQPGIERAEATTRSAADAPPMKVWIYRPMSKPASRRPCVLVAPAGSTGINGIGLVDEDAAEHVPYVREGFVVVAYELDGPQPAQRTADQALGAIRSFIKAEGGVANARAALELALNEEPAIDPARLYTAGHSSAANVALLVAARDARVRGCVAYAPASDLVSRFGAEFLAALDQAIPGAHRFVEHTQPLALADRIKCAVFLFHAEDDENVPVDQSRALAAKLKAAGNEPTLEIVKTGGHSRALLDHGLERGAAFLAEIARRHAKATTRPS